MTSAVSLPGSPATHPEQGLSTRVLRRRRPPTRAFRPSAHGPSARDPWGGAEPCECRLRRLWTCSPVLDAPWARTGLDAVVTCERIDDDIDIESLLTPGAAFIVQEAVPAGCPAPGRSHDSHGIEAPGHSRRARVSCGTSHEAVGPTHMPAIPKVAILSRLGTGPIHRRAAGSSRTCGPDLGPYSGSSDEPAARWDR